MGQGKTCSREREHIKTAMVCANCPLEGASLHCPLEGAGWRISPFLSSSTCTKCRFRSSRKSRWKTQALQFRIEGRVFSVSGFLCGSVGFRVGGSKSEGNCQDSNDSGCECMRGRLLGVGDRHKHRCKVSQNSFAIGWPPTRELLRMVLRLSDSFHRGD